MVVDETEETVEEFIEFLKPTELSTELETPKVSKIKEPKVAKENKEKPAKTPKKEAEEPDETTDSKKNTDDPNGQLTLF